MNSIKRKSYRLLFIAIAVLLMIGGGIFIYKALQPPAPAKKEPQAVNTPVPSKPKAPAEPLISLPGAKPIKAMAGVYTADDHLWKYVGKSQGFNNPRYAPESITEAKVPTRSDKPLEERSLRADVMPMLDSMFADAKTAGHSLMIGSGYRTYAQQQMYFSSYSKTYGEAKAATFSARPGHSEHQSGLAFDIAYIDRKCYLDECFGDSPAGKWITAHAPEYGFIISYPKEKAGTEYVYEPWHLRYVGKDLAGALTEAKMTLSDATPYLLKQSKP